jgi:hypothetical protein
MAIVLTNGSIYGTPRYGKSGSFNVKATPVAGSA